MPKAKVTPNGPWPVATSAVVEYEQIIHPNVPIIRMINMPGAISIKRANYPNGVVVLCDFPTPHNSDPISLPVIISTENSVEIEIPPDCIWPCCYVILWA
jgi:hypothetical protein